MAVADAIVDANARKNLSFEQLNQGTGLSRPLLWLLCSGNTRCRRSAKLIFDRLELGDEAARLLETIRFAAASRRCADRSHHLPVL